MQQPLAEEHRLDERGRPAGGETTGTGIAICWQHGPLGRGEQRQEPNGAFVEGVIQAAVGRLRHYQETVFACVENAETLKHLEEALAWCQKRTATRETQGVEGTHDLHQPDAGGF